jgi:hypothetical protein
MYLKQFILKIKNKLLFICVLFLSAYGLYLRLAKLSRHELWADEYYQLAVMNGSFWDMLRAIPKHEYGSYLSGDLYLTYPFFKIFGFNKWGLAIPHIVMIIIGFYFLYRICQRNFKTSLGYLIAFSVFCFNATMIWHATEIRWYAVLPALAVISFYYADILVNEYDVLTRRKKILIGGLFTLISWFYLYGAFMPYLSMAFFLFSKPRDGSFKIIFRKIFKFMLVVSVVIAPLWLVSVLGVHFQAGAHLNINSFEFIPNPLVDLVGFLKAVLGNLVGDKRLYFLLLGLFFPFFMRNKVGQRQIAFLLMMVFLPITVLFVVDVCSFYYFIQRQFIWVMPFFAFFLGWSWESLFLYGLGKIHSLKDNRN